MCIRISGRRLTTWEADFGVPKGAILHTERASPKGIPLRGLADGTHREVWDPIEVQCGQTRTWLPKIFIGHRELMA